MIDVAVYDLVSRKVWKSQTFTTSDTFIAPTDVFFATGSGGGGGGATTLIGGASGSACEMVPVITTKGSVIDIVIGAGGTIAGIGGTTTIGTQISLPGGKAGNTTGVALGGLRSLQSSSLSVDSPTMCIPDANTIGNYITGADTYYQSASANGSGNSRYPSGGKAQGAGGYFGAGGNNAAAAANTGAGGGINKAGGSGKVIIFWRE